MSIGSAPVVEDDVGMAINFWMMCKLAWLAEAGRVNVSDCSSWEWLDPHDFITLQYHETRARVCRRFDWEVLLGQTVRQYVPTTTNSVFYCARCSHWLTAAPLRAEQCRTANAHSVNLCSFEAQSDGRRWRYPGLRQRQIQNCNSCHSQSSLSSI